MSCWMDSGHGHETRKFPLHTALHGSADLHEPIAAQLGKISRIEWNDGGDRGEGDLNS